jgi:predicted nucleic acid-binding protein
VTGYARGYLLDTHVVSEWTKPVPNAGLIAFLEAVDEDRLFLSVVTLTEVRRGVDLLPEGRKRRHLDAWLAHDLRERFDTRLLDVDAAIADHWGRLSAKASRAGRQAPAMDCLIAATAAAHDLVVVTRNVSDFAHFEIEILNPWTA